METLEQLVLDVFAECTSELVVGIERQRRPNEHKEITREALAMWRQKFQETVEKELREVAGAGTVADARAAWESGDEGRDYVLRQIGKIARRAYLESGFGWSIDDEDIDEAVQRRIQRTDKRFKKLEQDGKDTSNKKRWCE